MTRMQISVYVCDKCGARAEVEQVSRWAHVLATDSDICSNCLRKLITAALDARLNIGICFSQDHPMGAIANGGELIALYKKLNVRGDSRDYYGGH